MCTQRSTTSVQLLVIFVTGVSIGYFIEHGKVPHPVRHPAARAAPPLSARDVWNVPRMTYDAAARSEFERLLRKGAGNEDAGLVRLVSAMLEPPSRHPRTKTTHGLFQTPQAKAVEEIFAGQQGLFFVEAGALDGERSSNTLWLEAERQWQGLLVEVDPYFYTQLKGKARKAWTVNACLSGKLEQLSFSECSRPNGGCGHLENGDGNVENSVPCFSLHSMMLALNRTTIDYFSLDVEGHEYQVLGTIPWDRLNIKVMTIEYPPTGDWKQEVEKLTAYMKARGYAAKRTFTEQDPVRQLFNRDVLFVKE